VATVAEAFARNVATRRDRTAVSWREVDGRWRSWTMGELGHQVARAAAGLAALGVGPGDRVLLMVRNVAEFHVADLAATFCGATPVSAYPSSSADQLAYLASHIEAKVAVVENAEFLRRLSAVRAQIPSLQQVVVIRQPPEAVRDGVMAWTRLLRHEPVDLAAAAASVRPDIPATIIYTTGATGRPKGVVLTHANVLAQATSFRTEVGDTTSLRVISYLPTANIVERVVSHYGMVFNGLEVCCCPDPDLASQCLTEVRPHIVFGPPRIWEAMHSYVLTVVASDPERARLLEESVEAAKPLALARSRSTATDADDDRWHQLQGSGLRQIREMIGLDNVRVAMSGGAPSPQKWSSGTTPSGSRCRKCTA
jgi:long-chain acyl-CoA synthetase